MIDDADNRIRYEGSGWVQDITGSQDEFGTFGATYNHTLHATTFNDSLAFSFQGSSIKVFGSVNLSPTYGNAINDAASRPPWECFVDNVSIGTSKLTPYRENNWVLCENNHIGEGPHELTLNITMRRGTTFWIDYLQYSPSQEPPDKSVIVVDSNDPALSYDGSWRQTVSGQMMQTTTKGGKAEFNFTGTQLTWVGYIPVELPGNSSSASYAIDGGSPNSFNLYGHPPTDGTSSFNQLFFTTPQLAPGPHSIAVTYNGNAQYTPLTLDYIYLTTSPSKIAAGADPSADPSAGFTKPLGATKRVRVGAIVGGVIGGVAVVILIAFIFFWRARRRKAMSDRASASSFVQYASEATYNPSHTDPVPVVPGRAFPLHSTRNNTRRTTSEANVSPSTEDSPLQSGGGYMSGAMAQIGDRKRRPSLPTPPQRNVDATPSHTDRQSDFSQNGHGFQDESLPLYTRHVN
ncbi:hypothetical protein DXG03_007334 [Asterophora parasitica]|uniref:Uncharacterized protein n=1 Tax=Asterophora parasitica TaxID=117018 RepID=A0A9P7G6W9_9AGAR|nr:hypothetical protein DXG03_007334 [Asterophora parasitica]